MHEFLLKTLGQLQRTWPRVAVAVVVGGLVGGALGLSTGLYSLHPNPSPRYIRHTLAAQGAAPNCEGSQLQALPQQYLGAGTGNAFVEQLIKNTSATQCLLEGYPQFGVAPSGAANSAMLMQRTTDGSASTAASWVLAPVALAPGSEAVYYEIVGQLPSQQGSCDAAPEVSGTYELIIPGSAEPITLGSGSFHNPVDCASEAVTVSPFLPDGTASGLLSPVP